MRVDGVVDAEGVEEVVCNRWRRSKHGRAVRKSDTGDLEDVEREMMAALRQSPDIIAKVGNSYKKRLKVASRVEMFPKLLEEIQKQRDAMQQAKRFDKKTAEWRSHIKEVAKPKFGGTDEEWRR